MVLVRSSTCCCDLLRIQRFAVLAQEVLCGEMADDAPLAAELLVTVRTLERCVIGFHVGVVGARKPCDRKTLGCRVISVLSTHRNNAQTKQLKFAHDLLPVVERPLRSQFATRKSKYRRRSGSHGKTTESKRRSKRKLIMKAVKAVSER